MTVYGVRESSVGKNLNWVQISLMRLYETVKLNKSNSQKETSKYNFYVATTLFSVFHVQAPTHTHTHTHTHPICCKYFRDTITCTVNTRDVTHLQVSSMRGVFIHHMSCQFLVQDVDEHCPASSILFFCSGFRMKCSQ